MNAEEFNIQKNLGAIPKEAELKRCQFCTTFTPQVLDHSVKIPLTPGEFVLKEYYDCYICKKSNIFRRAKDFYF